MRITRLHLRNYRVYEEPLDLEVPPGLVGVYGVNGAGKSVLLESILFCLWGRARTPKEEIRTAGVNAECVTEVEFEHEGHLYVVRRTIGGQSCSVKAQAHADGSQVAEGVRDTSRYVHSVLGMDDAAFRASVFAEQKQLAAFSSNTPAERKRLVLQLLGITPLDAARDQARKDARATAEQLDRIRILLPDRAGLAEQVDGARRTLAEAEAAAATADAALARAAGEQESADAEVTALADIAAEYQALVGEGTSLRRESDGLATRIDDLRAELDRLQAAAGDLARLEADAAGLSASESVLGLVEAAVQAGESLAAMPQPVVPAGGSEAEHDALAAEAVLRAGEARNRLAEVDGELRAARGEAERASAEAASTAGLSGEGDCPLCGQALGDAFAQVQAHRAAEAADAGRRVAELDQQRSALAGEVTGAGRRADELTEAARLARAAWAEHARAVERREAAAAAHRTALEALGREPEDGEVERLRAEVARRRRAAEGGATLRGRLERRSAAAGELEAAVLRQGELTGRLQTLRDKVHALGFHPDQLDAARRRATAAASARQSAEGIARQASQRVAAASAQAEGASVRLADAEAQHAKVAALEDEARHQARLAELLVAFRNAVVGTVGPRLSTQAADLFAELTDHEYDRLEVDPETYDIQIRDAGHLYGMDRFSGSETDLANLALRVAISEHVRFQSGGAVGLLVLDEVFGPLDDERKERMLLALERLRGRFRQVLVVTHDSAIKEQLPNAIEVVKLRGRRATARLI